MVDFIEFTVLDLVYRRTTPLFGRPSFPAVTPLSDRVVALCTGLAGGEKGKKIRVFGDGVGITFFGF